MATEYKTLQPQEFYKTFLDRKSRPDGRNLLEFRTTTLNVGSVGTADGSAIIKCGNTTVVCGIKAEVGPPSEESPGKGYIIPNVTLPPLCSPRIKSGPPGELAQTSSQFMADLVKNDLVMELEKLCIKESKWVWVLNADLICLNLDGGLLDACVVALIAALKNVVLPKINYDEELDQLTTDTSIKTNLEGVNLLVASTFGIFDNEVIISDPTDEEEQLAEGLITITMEGKEIANLYKQGGHCIDENKLETLIKKAEQRSQHVMKLLNEAISVTVER